MKAARRYRGLILDFGGVVVKSFFETRVEFEKLLGLTEGTLEWRGPFDPQSDALWRRTLSNEISEGEYWARRATEAGVLLGEHWTFQDFCRRYNDLAPDIVLRPEARRLLADARQEGVRLAILTNELERMNGIDWVKNNAVVRLFDALIDATHTKIPKPNPGAYRLALRALGLRAEEAIFVDDQIKNVRGAEAIGICSIHLDITNPRAAFDAVTSLLRLPARRQGS